VLGPFLRPSQVQSRGRQRTSQAQVSKNRRCKAMIADRFDSRTLASALTEAGQIAASELLPTQAA